MLGWSKWTWHYTTSKARRWLMLAGAVIVTVSLDPIIIYEWEPDYHHMAAGLTTVGTGCAMLAYHTRKGDEEDAATKKKIILVGTAAVIPIAALGILDVL